MSVEKCKRCRGCGRIADTRLGYPWSAWEALPAEARIAVALGIVRPIPCPDCRGKHEEEEP